MKKNKKTIDENDLDQLIRAAWEDDVSFESIFIQYGFTEDEVIDLMKKTMKPKMFITWRQRVRGRAEKHAKKTQLEALLERAYE